MSNLVGLPLLSTKPAPTIGDAVRKHVTAHSDEFNIHPDELAADYVALQRLRKTAAEVPEVHAQKAGELLLYFAQLTFLRTKLPDDIGVAFTWSRPFQTLSSDGAYNLPGSIPTRYSEGVTLSSIAHERFSVLYNLAALYSALGKETSRQTLDGLKLALAHFQSAAGVLEELARLQADKKEYEKEKNGREAMVQLCLGQAMECFWQKAVMDRMKNGTIAKLALKVSSFYEQASTLATTHNSSMPAWVFPQELLNHLRVKKAHFEAVAQFRKSIDDLGSNDYGVEIGRLQAAQDAIKVALDGPKKGINETVLADLKALGGTIADNLKRANKDNDLIYHEFPVATNALPPLALSVSMVKPTVPPLLASPISHLHEGSGGLGQRPLFDRLVPWVVHEVVSLWDDRKETYFRERVKGRAEELDAIATSTLSSLNLPASLDAVLQPVGLPPSLLRHAQEVRTHGGWERLKAREAEVTRVRDVDAAILVEAFDMLAREDAEDSNHRARFGTERWTRPQSMQVGGEFWARGESFRQTLDQARNSDKLVSGRIAGIEHEVRLLGSDDQTIQARIPSSALPPLRTATASGGSSAQQEAIQGLRRLLESLSLLQRDRSKSVVDGQRAFQAIDLRPTITRRVAELNAADPTKVVQTKDFEELFDQELDGASRWSEGVNESAKLQEDLLDRIRVANDAFLAARKKDDTLLKREQALHQLDDAFDKYREISTNLEEGLKFYNDFSRILTDFRDNTKGFVYARAAEARDIVSHLGMESLSIQPPAQQAPPPKAPGSPKKPGRHAYDPAKDGPIRFA